MKLWRALNSNIGVVVSTFLLTGVVGTYINSQYQNSSWVRQRNVEILQRRLADGTVFVDELSNLIDERRFGLRRVVSEARRQNNRNAQNLWDEYFRTVVTWNQRINTNTRKVRVLGGRDLAIMFLDPNDERRLADAKSVHGKIAHAHELVLKLRDCLSASCDEVAQLLAEADLALDEFDQFSAHFLDELAASINEDVAR